MKHVGFQVWVCGFGDGRYQQGKGLRLLWKGSSRIEKPDSHAKNNFKNSFNKLQREQTFKFLQISSNAQMHVMRFAAT